MDWQINDVLILSQNVNFLHYINHNTNVQIDLNLLIILETFSDLFLS